MRANEWTRWLLAFCCLTLLAGCGRKETRRPVSGSVTFEDQPLTYGSINFLSTVDPPGPMCGALIEAGRFNVPAEQGLEPGTYRVMISSPGPGGERTQEQIDAGASVPGKERIPPKYNSASTLTVEVTASGANQFDFHVE